MSTVVKNIPGIIENSLENAMTYDTFIARVDAVVKQGKSTGNDPDNKDLANYSKLTYARLKRVNKTLKIDEETASKIAASTKSVTWVVLTESWCGDAGQTLPVINKVAELNPNVDLKVLLRDDNEELMNEFLTNGGKAIPKLIAYDSEAKEVINTWGPRPSEATKLVNDYKEAHGKLTPEFKQDLQVWYNKDKGKNTIDDLLKLF